MRTRPLLLLLLSGCLLLQSCAPDEYAAELSALLTTYAEQVSRRLVDEEKRYRREAKILQDDDDKRLSMSVDEELATTAKAVAADIKAGRATGDRVVDSAATFGQAEFERARQIGLRNQDAELQRIRTLQSLQMDSAKIEGLRAALKGLSKRPDWQSALLESAQFGRDTKNQLDLLSCGDLDEAVKQLTARNTKLTADIAAASDAEARKKLAEQQTAVRGALTAATEGRTATGHFDATTQTCK